MNKNLRIFCYVPVLMFFIASCNKKGESKITATELVQPKIIVEELITTQKEENKDEQQSDILELYKRMQKHEKLTNTDYDFICDFLENNTDESLSEGMGYELFEYLKGNLSNNNAFVSYLNEKDVSFKEKVQKALVQIMCIDIGEGNYSYDTFVKDFDMFKNSVSAKNAFKECMSNQ